MAIKQKPETVAAARARLESELGEPVRVTDPSWGHILRQGVIVRIRIGRWRGQTQFTLADLGFRFDDEEALRAAHEYIVPGYRLLLPRRYRNALVSIDTTARDLLSSALESGHVGTASKTFALKTHWGAFVPVAAFPDFKKRFLSLRTRYFDVLDEIVEDYDDIKERVKKAYIAIAADAYNKLGKQSGQDWNAIRERTLAFVERMIPSPAHIRASAYFEYELSYIPTPVQLAEEARRAEEVVLDREKLVQLRDLNTEMLQQQRQQAGKLLAEFEYNVRTQLYSLAYAATQSLLEMAEKSAQNGIAETGARVRAKIQWIKQQITQLDILDDAKLQEMIAQVDACAMASPEQVAQAAQQLSLYLRTQLEGLEIQIGRFERRMVEITVPEFEDRGQRQELETEVEMVVSQRRRDGV